MLEVSESPGRADGVFRASVSAAKIPVPGAEKVWRRALRLPAVRINSRQTEPPELERPFGRRVAQGRNADATGQPSLDGGLDQSRRDVKTHGCYQGSRFRTLLVHTLRGAPGETPLCILPVKYGNGGRGYVYIEAGHAAQSLMLQAVALGLASTMVGAFSDEQLSRVLHRCR